MNADITVKAKAYSLLYSDKTESKRRSVTDGATLPHYITISHVDAIDRKTKLPVKRSTLRIDMSHLDTGNVNPSPVPVTASLVVIQGQGLYQPTTTAIELVVDSLIQMLSGTGADASALDLTDEVFAGLQQ
jgi:hypothetical protein